MATNSALPLRIYLSTVPRDSDAERETLARRLPELGVKPGIEIILIDPLADPAPDGKGLDESWDLARRFAAIESCDFFLGILGIPGDLPGDSSTAESEIRFVLDPPEPPGAPRPKSFFYRRAAPEPDPGAVPRAAVYTGPEDLADRVLADLRAELPAPLRGAEPRDVSFSIPGEEEDYLPPPPDEPPKGVPEPPPAWAAPAAPAPGPEPGKPLPLHEDVRFSLYRPRIIAPLEWYPLVVFAHLDELSSELSSEDRDAIRDIENQAREAFAEVPQGFSGESEDSRLAVPDEAEITFVPEIPGVRFNPPRATFLWLEPLHREDFRLQASAALDGTTARGRLSVFLGNILLAEMNLKIQVDSRAAAVAPTSGESLGEREDASPYQNIFASYSHKDTAIVDEFQRYIQALGNRYLIDRETLRAGEVWDDRLRGMIREADVFQLFWSRNALQSQFVEQEWRYALSLGRDNFIRPTYWEDPLPELPERGLPPQELKRLHFHRFGGLPPVGRAAPAGVSPAAAGAGSEASSAPPMPPSRTSPPSRSRKLLWVTSAAALLFVCLTLPMLHMAKEDPTAMSTSTSTLPPPNSALITLGSQAGPTGEIPAEEQSTVFAPGEPVIASVSVAALPAGTQVGVLWVAPDGSTLAAEPRTVQEGEDHLTFELTSDLAEGGYRAEVWTDGRQVAQQPFEVNR